MASIKRIRISKKFNDAGEPMLFASVRFCASRQGWIFNTSLPGRGPSRRPWPTPWAAIPRWVKGQKDIHYSLVTEA